MKLLIAFILIGNILINPLNTNAQTITESELSAEQEVAVVEDVEGLRAEFKEYTQDPDTKIVKYEMILKSNINSDRVKITWTLRGSSSFVDKTQAIRNVVVKSGETYAIQIQLLPSGRGVTELVGKAESYKVDGNYIATVRKNFATSSSSEVLPLTSEYTTSKNILDLRNLFLTAIVIILLGAAAFFGYKKFRVWMSQ